MTTDIDAAQHASDPAIDASRIDAVIFDMDGVVTDTAQAHAEAWKRLFDDYRQQRLGRGQDAYAPFDMDEDYRHHVDGKPRFEGLNSFLQAKGIDLPWGNADDPPDRETVCGLGNRKNGYFTDWLARHKADRLADGVDLLDRVTAAGVKVGIFSSSRNARAVLASAGLLDRFDARVDGTDLEKGGMRGKPEPDMLIETARRLGAEPARAAVVEDAESGVRAGRAGDFRLVIGVDRGGNAGRLRQAGAHIVVDDLGRIAVRGAGRGERPIAAVPDLWRHEDAVRQRLAGRTPMVFLDYDGTLTPIVADYTKAVLSDEMRGAIAELAARTTVAVISGRDMADVRRLVALQDAYYAGSHGFEIAGPGGLHEYMSQAKDFLPALDAAEEQLREAVGGIDGALVERKTFSIAVHYRNVAESDAPRVEATVDAILADRSDLTKGGGKKVFELKPAVDWDKGHAVDWLRDRLGARGPGAIAVYVGDDLTDEDAFKVLSDGLSIVVRGEDNHRTAADYSVADPDDVRRLLEFLTDQLPTGPS